MPHMTQRVRRYWLAYIRSTADLMGLRDHRFALSEEPPEEGKYAATINCVDGARWSNIRLSSVFFGYTPEVQREIVVHELLHAHFAASDAIVHRELGRKVYQDWEMCMEYAVDGVAASWARHLPLPRPVTSRSSRP